jgi:hypothetical protein
MEVGDNVYMAKIQYMLGPKVRKFKLIRIFNDYYVIQRNVCPIRKETLKVPKDFVSETEVAAKANQHKIVQNPQLIQKV